MNIIDYYVRSGLSCDWNKAKIYFPTFIRFVTGVAFNPDAPVAYAVCEAAKQVFLRPWKDCSSEINSYLSKVVAKIVPQNSEKASFIAEKAFSVISTALPLAVGYQVGRYVGCEISPLTWAVGSLAGEMVHRKIQHELQMEMLKENHQLQDSRIEEIIEDKTIEPDSFLENKEGDKDHNTAIPKEPTEETLSEL